MADIKQIEKLMTAMGRHRMKRLLIKEEGLELELERESRGEIVPAAALEQALALQPIPKAPEVVPSTAESGIFITSPMVGTFYFAPSPEDAPYVKVGDEVNEKSIVCIVEAMKVMNEVKAALKGRIAEILVKSGDPVEFGTKIFRVIRA